MRFLTLLSNLSFIDERHNAINIEQIFRAKIEDIKKGGMVDEADVGNV